MSPDHAVFTQEGEAGGQQEASSCSLSHTLTLTHAHAEWPVKRQPPEALYESRSLLPGK